MNEVRKCSLSGVAFTMDADAFALLAEYIETLKKSYEDSADGDEIVADIPGSDAGGAYRLWHVEQGVFSTIEQQ